MKEYGQVMPIIVKVEDEEYTIVEGHHRFVVCRELRIPVKFIICNINLDIAIELSERTNKWKKINYIQRGLYYKVPLLEAIEYELREGVLANEEEYMQYYKIILMTLCKYDKKFPSEVKVVNMLKTEGGIEKLKALELSAEDRYEIKQICTRYLELKNISLKCVTEHQELGPDGKPKYKALQVGTHFINAFSSCYYKIIAPNDMSYQKFKTKWEEVCKFKNKSAKEVYLKMTSSDEPLIKEAILDIYLD